MHENKTDNFIENTRNQILSDIHIKDGKHCTTTIVSKTDDKEDDSKQSLTKKIKIQDSVQMMKPCNKSLNSRYQLNVRNYIPELYKALTKECNDNLLDHNTLNVTLDLESLTNVTARTLKAIKDQKVFSILGYFPTISEELKKRGWVEKRDPYKSSINYSIYLKSTPNIVNSMESPPVISSSNKGNDAIWEKMKNAHSWSILKDKRSDLIFVTRKRLVNWASLHKLTTISQMERHVFCSKNGLAQCLEPYKNTETNLMFPRCHYIRNEVDYNIFLEDYIITALVSTLKIIIQAIEKNKRIFSENGNIPFEMINFVSNCVLQFLNKQQTRSKENDLWKFECQKEIWNTFMNHYTKLISDDQATFNHEYTNQLELDVYAKCNYLLENVQQYCPQHYIDGNTNMWIIKPTLSCSGHGIILSRDLKTIKDRITVVNGLRSSYILQKYIERPLLVYTCKIDLRQWFLVTNMNPVVVWMYKEGYVRFCANNFSMKNMHESIHLSNVRLQMKYRRTRYSNVPEECMWDYKELQNYLTTIGQEYVWEELIFPGMSQSVYTVIQAAAGTSFYRENTFQLFGADFVITDNYVPYLIEINSIPGLNPSTSIIANLAPMLLEDIIKVVVDYKENPSADTGLFMMVVPEKLNSAADRHTVAVKQTEETTPISGTSVYLRNEQTSINYRRLWMKNVNDKLSAVRFRINTQEPSNDHYLGNNRDMLKTATISSDVKSLK